MLKSVKISVEAYKAAKQLEKELEKNKIIEGVFNISIGAAISYALNRTLEDIGRERKFKEAAGSWKDVDTDKMLKTIYEGRKFRTRWDLSFD